MNKQITDDESVKDIFSDYWLDTDKWFEDDEDEEENEEEVEEKDNKTKDKDAKEKEETQKDDKKPKKKKDKKTFVVKSNVTFKNIIGLGDEMKDIQNIVNFLKDREEYDKRGATLPKGILLSGPPGVGKTFIAKAIAGEAGLPFLYLDGGNIEGPLVGQGSRKLKEAFKEAREKQPSILFIDEIDSIGGKRDASASSPYARETINALLSEMDGFDKDAQVMVIGSTNLADILDEALTRSGRFDLKIYLPKPAVRQREALLQHYLKNVRTAVDLDVDQVSRTTFNMTPADIKNLINTAGRHAVKHDRPCITQTDLTEGNDQLSMGIGMTHKMKTISDESRWNVCWHEAGHALVSYLMNEKVLRVTNLKDDPIVRVNKITIVPRGNSGGHTAFLGRDGEMFMDEAYAHLMMGYGGYVGEETYADSITDPEQKERAGLSTGPSGDFSQATRIAKEMVYHKLRRQGEFQDWGYHNQLGHANTEFKEKFDEEMLKLTNKAYTEAKELLKKNYQKFKVLAECLYHYEQITYEEMVLVLEKMDPHAIKQSSTWGKKFVFNNNRPTKAIGIRPKDVPEKIKEIDLEAQK